MIIINLTLFQIISIEYTKRNKNRLKWNPSIRTCRTKSFRKSRGVRKTEFRLHAKRR